MQLININKNLLCNYLIFFLIFKYYSNMRTFITAPHNKIYLTSRVLQKVSFRILCLDREFIAMSITNPEKFLFIENLGNHMTVCPALRFTQALLKDN